MIEKLRKQFIGIATLAVIIIMAVLVIVTSVTIYSTINTFVDRAVDRAQGLPTKQTHLIFDRFIGSLNSDDVFYYQMTTDGSYHVLSYNDEHHPQALNRQTAQALVDRARREKHRSRFSAGGSHYAWFSKKSGKNVKFTFIDYSMLIRWAGQIRTMSILVSLAAFIVFEILVIALSGRAVRPTIENAENQKRFITNASHELKTPVAVISADNQVIEAMHGRDEWTESIGHQVDKLTSLINALVTLSKSSERDKAELTDTDISAVISDRADTFDTLITSKGLTFDKQIAPAVHAKTDAKILGQIADILLDNAAKYCDDDGTIVVSLVAATGHAAFTVANDYAEGKDVDYDKFFERFYRADTSHNAEKKGFGIGLSIASELTRAIGAKIKTDWQDGRIRFTLML